MAVRGRGLTNRVRLGDYKMSNCRHITRDYRTLLPGLDITLRIKRTENRRHIIVSLRPKDRLIESKTGDKELRKKRKLERKRRKGNR